MSIVYQGLLNELNNELPDTGLAQYWLPVGGTEIELNPRLGQPLQLRFSGRIQCVACGRAIQKSFQGYCFPCTQRLAACDLCIVKPELCHYHLGTCREPEWGLAHCMQPHYVYIANSSGLKVGITREKNVPYRFMDQGASQALPVLKTRSRYIAGLVEVIMKQHLQDKTDWRKMLRGVAEPIDLPALWQSLQPLLQTELAQVQQQHGESSVQTVAFKPYDIQYPVLQYPDKIVSLDLHKTPEMGGILWGIKGQYLLLDQGVLNVRKFSGYHIEYIC